MPTITVATRAKDEVVDITTQAAECVRQADKPEGLCVAFVAHTTCALTTADLDPGTDRDLLGALRKLLPPMTYRHPHDPEHAPDHILAAILGPSVSVPYAERALLLGTWQRVILVELDGPRERTVHLRCV
jgi:secondary thiamine-phosphate synthase enzyme